MPILGTQASQNIKSFLGLAVDYLVVAGGGSGGVGNAGGGGAGGLRSTVTATGGGGSLESALSLSLNTSYTVTVGAGGAAISASSGTNGNPGNNSVFSTIKSSFCRSVSIFFLCVSSACNCSYSSDCWIAIAN